MNVFSTKMMDDIKQKRIELPSTLKFLCIVMCLIIIIISMCIFINQQWLSAKSITLTTTTSSKDSGQSSLIKNILNISLEQHNVSSIIMNKFMRSIYNEINFNRKRKKRQLNSLFLSDDIDSITSLFNQYNHTNHYYFQYNSSIENLVYIEFNLPIKNLTNASTIEIQLNEFNLLFTQPFDIQKNLLKINLIKYIQKFPIQFFIKLNNLSLQSSGFLTLYIQQSKLRTRRDLSSFSDDEQLVTYPNNPTYCQVRPYRVSFSELNWTSWIVEPSSYQMNICSGVCQTDFNTPSYFTMQNLLNRISSKKIPSLCCKPKRFSSTTLLYYDGLNLILKRHHNMRVVECGCA